VSDLPVIASAFVSGFVAPSVVAWYALTSQRRDEERLDRAELRTVLDAAAHALGDSRRAVDSVAERWRRGEPRSSEDFREAAQRHGGASAAAQDAKDRISIRLKTGDDAVSAFEKAARALDSYAALLAPYLQGSGQHIDGAALVASRSEFITALDGYYAAAREVSGGNSRHAQRIAAVVALVAMIVGAVFIGAAYEADRNGGRLRVDGSEVQAVVSRVVVPNAGQIRCVPGQSDGLGVWRCVRPGASSKHHLRATVLSDGRVFVQLGTEPPHEACCVKIR
jgi:hypothetical protein